MSELTVSIGLVNDLFYHLHIYQSGEVDPNWETLSVVRDVTQMPLAAIFSFLKKILLKCGCFTMSC